MNTHSTTDRRAETSTFSWMSMNYLVHVHAHPRKFMSMQRFWYIYIIVMFYSMCKTCYLCPFLFLAFALGKVYWVMFVTTLTLLNYMNFFLFLHQPSCSRKVCGTFETVPFEVCSLFSLVFNYSQYLVQQCVDQP